MKITMNVEATAEEIREFLGLPKVRPLQDEMLEIMRKNMKEGATGFDAFKMVQPLMQPFFPAQMQSVEMMQKVFWDAFAKAGNNAEMVTQEPQAEK